MFTFYSQSDINTLVNPREGETKLGQQVQTLEADNDLDQELKNTSARFVILGVPEDIGVRMNYGNGGAHTSFTPALTAFLNIQENQFLKGEDILLLGHLDFLQEVENFDAKDRAAGDVLVQQIDKELSLVISRIVAAGKIPIVIGGGHNNAYGNIKGLSEGKNAPVNAINLDAHTDLRRLEERHSGNGFSYAIEHGYLERYFMFGLHENYTPQYIFEEMYKNPKIDYNTFEDLAIYQTLDFNEQLERAQQFVGTTAYGIEIDLDCIQYFPSSAMTPTGFDPQQARRFVFEMGKNQHASYLHICEGAPSVLKDKIAYTQVGKFISYLITDFIKSKNH